ncbi:MAG: hypothetical protein HYT85_11195 [candidate division NC10 bacterium]|nr:hypothetical protein [candidate division NC10 bacterium]MBI2162623.1 hypothetical protein [candidate division NC10 bacterium]MBI2455143.1 hypothetical protein [candidate division NC10 bacterium]
MKKLWIMAAALVLVLGAAGYTIAQSTGPQGGQGGMMGPGMGMMGGGMMGSGGQGGQGGQGGMMGSGMMSMMMGQPLTQEQLEQFAKQHGITPEQAKQMTDQCHQMMGTTTTPETQPKQ